LAEPIPTNYNDNNNDGDGADIINRQTKTVSCILFQILKNCLNISNYSFYSLKFYYYISNHVWV